MHWKLQVSNTSQAIRHPLKCERVRCDLRGSREARSPFHSSSLACHWGDPRLICAIVVGFEKKSSQGAGEPGVAPSGMASRICVANPSAALAGWIFSLLNKAF